MPAPATKIKPVRPHPTPANRLGLDYAAEARARPAPAPIIDVHAHIGGAEAARIYGRAADLFGVRQTWSMTHLDEVDAVQSALGDRVRFIAVPDYREPDRQHHLGRGYIERIRAYHERGARIAKFWAAPRGLDYGREFGDPDAMRLDAPARIEAMETAAELGMMFMTHVGDPDTWFRTKYADASTYGTKADQYEPLERLLERFSQPWIAAHFGGWPEDLAFVAQLLERHENLFIDTSATKWMIREISRQPRRALIDFLTRFEGRVLFGSDIVTSDAHLSETPDDPMGAQANNAEQAFDLYASRYWALRVMWETDYVGESPIADPDLQMVDPERWGPNDAPPLIGKSIPAEVLRAFYGAAAQALLAG
ncbi:MAG: amidohydrolase family protein [Planctomycetota bacterium]